MHRTWCSAVMIAFIFRSLTGQVGNSCFAPRLWAAAGFTAPNTLTFWTCCHSTLTQETQLLWMLGELAASKAGILLGMPLLEWEPRWGAGTFQCLYSNFGTHKCPLGVGGVHIALFILFGSCKHHITNLLCGTCF